MNFQEFLLSEGLKINAEPGLEQHLPKAKEVLQTYFQRYGNNIELKSSSARYHYTLIKYKKDYIEELFSFQYDLIDRGKGKQEVQDFGRSKKTYNTPKDAIESIPAEKNLAYRGMSWEEWRKAQKTGLVQSFGQHNFSSQKNLTFYGLEPHTGEAYAGGFAPIAHTATITRPGIVIAVPRNLLKSHKDNPNIPQGELAHEGAINIDNVVRVWMLNVIMSKPGKFDLTFNNHTNKIREGSAFGIRLSYTIRQFK